MFGRGTHGKELQQLKVSKGLTTLIIITQARNGSSRRYDRLHTGMIYGYTYEQRKRHEEETKVVSWYKGWGVVLRLHDAIYYLLSGHALLGS